MTPYYIDPYDEGGGEEIPLAQERLSPIPKRPMIIRCTPGKTYGAHVADVIDRLAAAFGVPASHFREQVEALDRMYGEDARQKRTELISTSRARSFRQGLIARPLAADVGQKAWDAWWPVAAEEAKLCIRCGVKHADDGTHPCGH